MLQGKLLYSDNVCKKTYPRVTTIINEVLPFYAGVDPALVEAQAELGTEVHSMCAILSRNNHEGMITKHAKELYGYTKAFRKFRDDYNFEPIIIEQAICSKKYKYAGRPDAIGWIHKKRKIQAVIDYSIGAIGLNKRLQLIAYFKAWKEISKYQGEITRIGVYLKEDGDYITYPFNNYNDWYGFLAALQFYRWKMNT